MHGVSRQERRKKISKHKHRKMLKKTRWQRRHK
ncbi:MAG: AURKAIP1/COX24 domain-containing protein [Chloroflexi bacterium]|nr:MAG: AURKAIP1/COX24 domain-containing protein [Chloroflexota bacterium]